MCVCVCVYVSNIILFSLGLRIGRQTVFEPNKRRKKNVTYFTYTVFRLNTITSSLASMRSDVPEQIEHP